MAEGAWGTNPTCRAISDTDVLLVGTPPSSNSAAHRALQSHQAAEQGRLPAAIAADEARDFPRGDLDVYPAKDR